MNLSQREVETFVKGEFYKQVDFCRQRFDLGSAWTPILKLSFAESRARSLGGVRHGKPFISLSLLRVTRGIGGFKEYDRYSHDKTIGSIRTPEWRIYVAALLAHELAHAVQFSLPNSRSNLKVVGTTYAGLGSYESGHGDFFRSIYRVMRKQFVNPFVHPDQIGVEPGAPVRPDAPKRPVHGFVGMEFFSKAFGFCEVRDYEPENESPFVVISARVGRVRCTQAQIVQMVSEAV